MELNLLLLLPIVGLISRMVVNCNVIDFESETSHVFTTVFYKYSERVRPYTKEKGPVNIKANIDVVDIISLDTKRNQLESIVDLRLTWNDPRLLWNNEKVTYITVNHSSVWTPDVQFLNTLESPDVVVLPRFVVIERPGDVYVYSRIRIKTACKRNKTSVCEIQIGSNVFTESQMAFTKSSCSVQDELLTSGFKVEAKNITANMSVVEAVFSSVPTMYSPKFNLKTYSVVSCTLKVIPVKSMEMTAPHKMDDDEEEKLDQCNSAIRSINQYYVFLLGFYLLLLYV